MNYWLKQSLEKQIPAEIIYQSKNGLISQRRIIVKRIEEDHVIACCLHKKQIRSFLLDSILSAGGVRRHNHPAS
ncbi:hypothetical protein LRR81_17850 [Metabacillus sp. GX 13764]|uniref:hypothetical protein n=1 Tax=Metabacillus kandeliae TaxID=2900151 RepID=UPI001E5E236C|nr:hypothetical protein [Metabacillus kandeliae]MCD7036109.1 hypothetical protein [Metabacillus kandeliae]